MREVGIFFRYWLLFSFSCHRLNSIHKSKKCTTNRQEQYPCQKLIHFSIFYAILYMKLIACLTFISRGLERPGRMGSTYLAMSSSTSGGLFILNRKSRHICTATEKLILYSYFLEPFSMTTCEVINSEKLYIISPAKISWSI